MNRFQKVGLAAMVVGSLAACNNHSEKVYTDQNIASGYDILISYYGDRPKKMTIGTFEDNDRANGFFDSVYLLDPEEACSGSKPFNAHYLTNDLELTKASGYDLCDIFAAVHAESVDDNGQLVTINGPTILGEKDE